jgi:hypothetical protein
MVLVGICPEYSGEPTPEFYQIKKPHKCEAFKMVLGGICPEYSGEPTPEFYQIKKASQM